MYIYLSIPNGYNQQAGKANADACSLTHTQKSEMETLPEAHGRSEKQSQPPETYAENDYGETTEEKSSVPVRQHFVLSNARYPFHLSPSL